MGEQNSIFLNLIKNPGISSDRTLLGTGSPISSAHRPFQEVSDCSLIPMFIIWKYIIKFYFNSTTNNNKNKNNCPPLRVIFGETGSHINLRYKIVANLIKPWGSILTTSSNLALEQPVHYHGT